LTISALQAGTRSFIGDIAFSHHVSITNHHRGPWVEFLTETLHEIPKWTSIKTRYATRARESKPDFSPTLRILHNSGKSTQPNCCVPYPAGRLYSPGCYCHIASMMILIITQEKSHLDPADL
jgi:hypothetical protein